MHDNSSGALLSADRKDYPGLDIFKLIMAVMVIAIHTGPLTGCRIEFLGGAFYSLRRLAVPFFFTASGFLLGNKLIEPYYCDQNQNSVKRQLKKILKMYLIWTAVYFPLTMYSYIKESKSIGFILANTVRKLIFRGENYLSWQLWYLLATIYALVLILITMKLKKKARLLYSLAAVIFLFSCFTDKIVCCDQTFPLPLELFKRIISYTTVDGRVFQGAFYLPLGVFLSRNKVVIKYAKYLAIPCIAAMCFYGETWLMIIGEISVFSLAASMKLKKRSIYGYLRKSSTITYLIHMYVYFAISIIIYGKDEGNNFLCFLLTTVFSVGISFAYIFISQKYNQRKMHSDKRQC